MVSSILYAVNFGKKAKLFVDDKFQNVKQRSCWLNHLNHQVFLKVSRYAFDWYHLFSAEKKLFYLGRYSSNYRWHICLRIYYTIWCYKTVSKKYCHPVSAIHPRFSEALFVAPKTEMWYFWLQTKEAKKNICKEVWFFFFSSEHYGILQLFTEEISRCPEE